MTRVKICGNTSLEDVKFVLEAGADFVGFIFAESKRSITARDAKAILGEVGSHEKFVGVFANQPRELVEKIATDLKLQWVQFHGDETSRYCDFFHNLGFKIIKTFRIKDTMSLKRIDEYNVDAFLFDTFMRGELGGTGLTFDWSLIKEKPYVTERLFLAGGLTPDNVESAILSVKPYAVDVASGVEKSPGVKDPALVTSFIEKVQSFRNVS